MADPNAIATDAEMQALFGMAPAATTPQPGSATPAPATAPDAPASAEEIGRLFAPPPATTAAAPPARSGGFLDNAWHSIVGLGQDALQNFARNYQEAGQPALAGPVNAPISAPNVVRGVRDIIDKPAQWLASAADATGLTSGQGADVAAQNEAARKAYDALPEDAKSTVGRIVGQSLAMLPLAATGTNLLGPALDAVSSIPLVGRLAANVATGAGIGAGQGALTAKPGEEGQGAKEGAEFGAVAGPVTSAAAAAGRAGWNALTGVSANVAANIARRVPKAQSYGINPEAFQLSPNLLTRIGGEYLGMLPFSGRSAAMADNIGNWRKAVAATMGAKSSSLDPVTMSDTADRLRNVFQSAAPQISIPMDQAMLTDLTSVQQQAQRYWADPVGMQKLNSLVDDVFNAHYTDPANPGVMSGQQYLSLTNEGSPLERAAGAKNDPDLRYYAGQIRSALDSALTRYAPADVQDSLTAARSQWRAMKTVEDAVEASPTGELEPGRLFQAALNHSRRFDPSTGGLAYQPSELGDLGRIGSLFLAPQRSSGTAEKATAIGALGTLGGMLIHDPLAAVPYAGGVGLGLAANRGLQSYMRSPWLTGRMITPAGPLAPTRNALPWALPAEQGLLGDTVR